MGSLPAELQELVDRQMIYHVLTTYCRALDRCDVELMMSVYGEDGGTAPLPWTGQCLGPVIFSSCCLGDLIQQ
jgi:hypothetical protein